MKRIYEDKLQEWQAESQPMPILLRGARQVGKSYIVEKFAKENFKNHISINFEFEPEFCEYFENTLDPQIILEKICSLKSQEFTKGKTLLFLDEIQVCPRAILALRYFYEKMPGAHVIGAGSLLDFALEEQSISFPVGRIQFMFLQPMSFYEFLMALGEDGLLKHIQQLKLGEQHDHIIHERLLENIRRYFILGGMPKILDKYLEVRNFISPIDIQDILIYDYREDFSKYAKIVKHKYLQKVFEAVPKQVTEKFKYSKVDPDIKSRELKEALESLEKARIVHKVKSTSGSGLPFEAEASEKHFKSIFLDIGLMQNLLGMDQGLSQEIIRAKNFHSIAAGSLAEQFVGQELLANSSFNKEKRIYYWERRAKASTAEVDYLTAIGNKIVPIEVKADKDGHLKSLKIFMEKYNSPLGIKISQGQLELRGKILSIPFYMIGEIPRLGAEVIKQQNVI